MKCIVCGEETNNEFDICEYCASKYNPHLIQLIREFKVKLLRDSAGNEYLIKN